MSRTTFCDALGYSFRNEDYLTLALTHSSYTHEGHLKKWESNERLEFLGDAVFDTVISEYLYNALPEVEEGKLTRLRALVVCEHSLAQRALSIRLGDELTLGRGEELGGGRNRTSIIADAMEAVIGAVFLDGGWGAAKKVILNNFMSTIEDARNGKLYSDYKTALQELCQQHGDVDLRYVMMGESGPDHCKTFKIGVTMNGVILGEGVGRTKKEAEQNAAREAMKKRAELEKML